MPGSRRRGSHPPPCAPCLPGERSAGPLRKWREWCPRPRVHGPGRYRPGCGPRRESAARSGTSCERWSGRAGGPGRCHPRQLIQCGSGRRRPNLAVEAGGGHPFLGDDPDTKVESHSLGAGLFQAVFRRAALFFLYLNPQVAVTEFGQRTSPFGYQGQQFRTYEVQVIYGNGSGMLSGPNGQPLDGCASRGRIRALPWWTRIKSGGLPWVEGTARLVSRIRIALLRGAVGKVVFQLGKLA